MPRVDCWADNVLYAALLERCEEEGVTRSAVLKEALTIYLGVTDPKPRRADPNKYGGVVQQSIGLPLEWWEKLNFISYERGMKTVPYLRELIREHLGIPVPEKVVRAKPNRALSEDAMMAHYEDTFTPEVRKLRSQEEEPPIEDWVEANPVGVHQVCECFVERCPNHLVGFHKHNNGELKTWVRWKRGEIALDRKTGKWSEKDG